MIVCASLRVTPIRLMYESLPAARGALKLSFFIGSLTVAALAARLASADVSPNARLDAQVYAITRDAGPRLGDLSLRRLLDSQDAGLFARFDPAAKQKPQFAVVHGFEGPAPMLRMFDLTPGSAEAINAGVPISSADNPPARPFVLKADTADRERAVQCLTQAVYFEAGFEPGEGQAAVAQVILNRMRHPIYPHSVCGVVYQGADLKTGCQFSFTCDGSLAKTPNQAAWDRSKAIAVRALGGYVEKSVGEATHYHTQWVVPWWQPTVSKVAQIGAHIFYRWPGALGLPGAFNGRYAGVERVVATPSAPSQVMPDVVTAQASADGRVHAVLALASNGAVQPEDLGATPRERMAALAAKGALGADFDPATVAAPAPKLEPVTLALAAPAVSTPKRAEPIKLNMNANAGCMTCSHW